MRQGTAGEGWSEPAKEPGSTSHKNMLRLAGRPGNLGRLPPVYPRERPTPLSPNEVATGKHEWGRVQCIRPPGAMIFRLMAFLKRQDEVCRTHETVAS